MDRLKRTEILVHCDDEFIDYWVKKIELTNEFLLVEKPSHSLTMVKVRESAQYCFFYLCEVLISEAKVQCNDKIGLGVIQGLNLNKAKSLAIIDAAYEANLEIIDELNLALLEEQKLIKKRRNQKIKQIENTKVNFEIMDI